MLSIAAVPRRPHPALDSPGWFHRNIGGIVAPRTVRDAVRPRSGRCDQQPWGSLMGASGHCSSATSYLLHWWAEVAAGLETIFKVYRGLFSRSAPEKIRNHLAVYASRPLVWPHPLIGFLIPFFSECHTAWLYPLGSSRRQLPSGQSSRRNPFAQLITGPSS